MVSNTGGSMSYSTRRCNAFAAIPTNSLPVGPLALLKHDTRPAAKEATNVSDRNTLCLSAVQSHAQPALAAAAAASTRFGIELPRPPVMAFPTCMPVSLPPMDSSTPSTHGAPVAASADTVAQNRACAFGGSCPLARTHACAAAAANVPRCSWTVLRHKSQSKVRLGVVWMGQQLRREVTISRDGVETYLLRSCGRGTGPGTSPELSISAS